MRDRLAWVARGVAEAAARRSGAAAELATVVEVVRQSHPETGPDEADRFGPLLELFHLDATDGDLLTVALAPALDPAIGRAFDLLTGRALQGRATVGLALELAGIGTATVSAARHLHPSASLCRLGLLDIGADAGWLDRTLQVQDRLRAHLVGDDGPDQDVAAATVDVIAYRCTVSDQIAHALVAGQGLIWVHGPGGTAGVSAAVAGFQEVGAECLVLDARLIDPSRLVDTVRRAALEAALAAAGLVIAGADVLVAAGISTVQALVASPVPVVAVGMGGWPPHLLDADPLTLLAPTPTPADRIALWATALDEAESVSARRPVTALRLSPEEVWGTARTAVLLAQAQNTPLTDATLQEAARRIGAGGSASSLTIGHVAHSRAGTASFADLVLPDRIEAELVRLVDWARHRHEVVAASPFLTKGGKGGGLAALFTGSPGTGKTLAAHVVADELGLELMQIDLSAIVDKYIGETEKNLEKVFRAAESRNVVLFFDEADALFGSRSSVQDAHDRYANQEVSYLLQRMEHFDGVTVLATNLRGNLDKAFQRRMQFIVHFPDPDQQTRLRLWQQHLAQTGDGDPADPVEVQALAESLELAGGDIRNIVLGATYDAAVAGRPVGQALVLAAAEREYQKLGRRSPTRS